MDDAFLIVVVAVPLLAFVAAIVALATSGGAYDQIGRGGMPAGEDGPPPDDRDAEIRQLLTARNRRRAARGEAPVDVEDELRSLTAPAADPELVAEVRRHVEARNARRVARGEPPLDVAAEVARRLRPG